MIVPTSPPLPYWDGTELQEYNWNSKVSLGIGYGTNDLVHYHNINYRASLQLVLRFWEVLPRLFGGLYRSLSSDFCHSPHHSFHMHLDSCRSHQSASAYKKSHLPHSRTHFPTYYCKGLRHCHTLLRKSCIQIPKDNGCHLKWNWSPSANLPHKSCPNDMHWTSCYNTKHRLEHS